MVHCLYLEMQGKEMNAVCRLCIGQNVQLHHVFESEIIPGWTAADAIWELLRIQVSESDLYPLFICAECIRKLIDFKLFKHQCEVNKETLDLELARIREVGVNEDVVGMVLCGNENQSELEEDLEVPIEKDPLDLCDEDSIKTEISDTSNDYNEILNDEVIVSVNQVSIPIKYEDQGRTVDDNEIIVPDNTSTEEMATIEEIPVSVRLLRSSATCLSKNSHQRDSPRRCRKNRDTATTALRANGKRPSILRDLLLGKTPVEEKEDDPVPNFRSTWKKAVPSHSRTEDASSCDNGPSILRDLLLAKTPIEDRDDPEPNFRSTWKEVLSRHSRTKDASYCDTSDELSSRTDSSNFECDKMSSRKTTLKGRKSIYPGEGQFRCDECRQSFSRKVKLTQHMRVHSKSFKCLECGNKFCNMSNLKTHTATHAGLRPFQCEICSKTFLQKGHLKTHMMVHSGDKPYQCQECKRTFSQKSNLNQHLMTHSVVRQYECEACGEDFSLKSELGRHVQTHKESREISSRQTTLEGRKSCNNRHPVEIPFQCDECGQSFSRKVKLTQHMKAHLKAFECLE